MAYQMYMLSKESIDIYIYDVDRKMVDYALSYGVLDRIPEERLHIVINPNPNGLLSDAKEMLDDISYNVDVAIDYVGTRKVIKYNSLGYAGILYSKIYYKKGQQNLTTARGGGGPLFTSYYYSINNSLFSIYPEIYLKVQGEHYVDNELYDYT